MPKREEGALKKAYEAPALTIYGKVHDMTKTYATQKKADGLPSSSTGFIG